LICDHLTSAEAESLRAKGAAYGTWSALTAAIPVSVALMFRDVLTVGPAAVLLAIHISRIPSWFRSQRDSLCSTAWAQEHGFSPDTLKLFGFGGAGNRRP